MIRALVPLSAISCVLKDAGYEVAAELYLDRHSITITFADAVSFEFALVDGKLRMVTRCYSGPKPTAEAVTIADVQPRVMTP